MALSQKKSEKVWIWKAFDPDRGRLLDWECGGRDRQTLDRLLGRLKAWKVRLHCTDGYGPYVDALPVGKHLVGKDRTWRLEQNNGRQRHWFARFRRRSIVVTRSMEMLEATMRLFAACHVNGSDEKLLAMIF